MYMYIHMHVDMYMCHAIPTSYTAVGMRPQPSFSHPHMYSLDLAIVSLVPHRMFAGPLVNSPLDVPGAVSDDWRNDSVYSERMWGSYRYGRLAQTHIVVERGTLIFSHPSSPSGPMCTLACGRGYQSMCLVYKIQ